MPDKDREVSRSVRRIAILTGAILVALVVVLTVVLAAVDQEVVAARVADYVLPKVSERLGRKVTVESARARVLPNPHVTLTELTVHGVGKEPALLEAAEVEVDLALWPLLTSFGKEIRVQRVRLVRPELNLVRAKDGSWNYEDLQQKDEQQPPSEREVSISTVAIEGGAVRIIDRSTSHGEATLALTQVDATTGNIGGEGPTTFQGTGAFASDEQNLSVDLTLSELPKGGQSATKWPEVKGMLSVTNGSLARLEGFLPAKLGKLITGGTFNFDADLTTAKDGRYQIVGDAALNAVQLRGEPAKGSVHIAARVDPNRPSAPRVELSPIALEGPGIDLGGSATIAGDPLQVEFALKGKRLDLETLLGVIPEGETTEPRRTAMLPARMRNAIDDIRAEGTLQLDEVVNGELAAQNLDAQATLQRGVLTLQRAQADFYEGKVDASGTKVDLTQPLPKWNLKARLEQVALGKAMASISGAAPVEGKLDAALDVVGEGAEWGQVQKNVTGRGTLALSEGALTSTDLGEKLAATLAEGLRKMGQGGAGAAVDKATGTTPLKDLSAAFTVNEGWMQLREPMRVASSMGALSLDGRIGLDQQLDLDGKVRLSQDFLTRVLPKQVRPRGAADVPVAIGGTLRAPALQGPAPGELAKDAAKEQLDKGAEGLKDEVKRQARKRAGEFFERLDPGQ